MGDFNVMLTFERSKNGWLALASILRDGAWHDRGELGEQMAKLTDLQPQSAANLLYQARAAGFIKGRMRSGRRQYSVTEEGRRQRPELRVP